VTHGADARSVSVDAMHGEAAAARAPRWIAPLLVCVLAIVATVALENAVLARAFPHLLRFTTDFSPAYLARELAYVRTQPPQTIFFGDSVTWGYRLPPAQNAVSLLEARGCACVNFSLKAGSPPNSYALARLLVADGIRPRAVVVEINQKAFNAADDTYQTLHPGIAALAAPLLTPGDRATLRGIPAGGPRAQLEHALDAVSLLYAMRSDVRETLYGDADTVAVPHPTADLFEGTYDLSPLTPNNVGVRYLDATFRTLRAAHVPVVAFMTPTNHALLHEYIDAPQYRANVRYLVALARRDGARVYDWDDAFPGRLFFDNAHLTAEGQRRLAALLAHALGEPAPALSSSK